jgi:DMSO reductase anchor subunit
MHPALSVIVFTAASGAGYGLLALTALFNALGMLPPSGWFGFVALGLALALITSGLLASTAHLGHPERAWRALSQWRSSWLSREGIAALATYVPVAMFGIAWVFFGRSDGIFALAGLLAAALAAATVYCTAMIYASLKPVHQWHNALVAPNYLALALMTGALWLNALLAFWSAPRAAIVVLAVAAVALAAALKIRYWTFIDATRSPATPASAIGLAARGAGGAQPAVRQLDPPHTEANYLLKEMGFAVARAHALRLRRITLGLAFVLPVALVLASIVLPWPLDAAAALLAALAASIGVLIERWLFFAQAKHTVTLYYGAAAA